VCVGHGYAYYILNVCPKYDSIYGFKTQKGPFAEYSLNGVRGAPVLSWIF
jgi:hypothetical protein